MNKADNFLEFLFSSHVNDETSQAKDIIDLADIASTWASAKFKQVWCTEMKNYLLKYKNAVNFVEISGDWVNVNYDYSYSINVSIDVIKNCPLSPQDLGWELEDTMSPSLGRLSDYQVKEMIMEMRHKKIERIMLENVDALFSCVATTEEQDLINKSLAWEKSKLDKAIKPFGDKSSITNKI